MCSTPPLTSFFFSHSPPVCFEGQPELAKNLNGLSLYIIIQITSAGPALSGYTQINQGLKMKSKG